MWAKQSTAATLIVGPILDSTGAEYTSAVIGDLSISKNGGTLTALAAAATLTHIANGQYTLVLTTGNLDTLGRAQITCNKSTYQMPPIGLVVVPAMVFDSMVLGTDVLQSDTIQFGGTNGTFDAGKPTAVLDSAVATQIDTIEAALTTLGSDSTTVERSVSDTNAITFSWPVSGATITGTASLNNGSYGAVAGAIAFLRTETGRHYYTLAYNVADRPAAEGQVRYKFVDGTYTGYVVLRTVNLVTAAQVNAQVLDVLSVDTFGELSSPPAATSSLKDKLVWLFMWARNKATATSSQRKLYADDTTTVVSTETVGDDGVTFTKGEAS
jgi:hypothetical protein